MNAGARLSRAVRSVPGLILIVVVLVVWVLPLVGTLVTSLRPGPDAASAGWWRVLADGSLTLEAYRQVLDGDAGGGGLHGGLIGSVAVAFPATLLSLVVGVPAAQAFAWGRFRGREWLFLAVVALLFLPLPLVLIPLASLMADGLVVGDTRLIAAPGSLVTWPVLWVAHAALCAPLVVLLMRNALESVPRPMVDAARSDGATEAQILTRIGLPLAVPAVVAIAALVFLWVWNDLLLATVILGPAGNATVTLRLAELAATRGHQPDLLAAGAVLTAVVPLVIYVVLRRWVLDAARAATFDR